MYARSASWSAPDPFSVPPRPSGLTFRDLRAEKSPLEKVGKKVVSPKFN